MWCSTVLTLCLLMSAGCKPQKPDIIEARREAAQKRLAGAELIGKQKVTQEKLANKLTPEQDNVIVARIGEKTITVGDVIRQIDGEGVELRSLYMVPQKRRDLVEQMIEKELMVAEAEKKGLGRHPMVQHAWKKAMVLEYLREYGSKMTIADITDEAAKSHYEKYLSQYVTPEKRRASVLIVGGEKQCETIRTELMAAIATTPVKTRQIFEDFVRRYTEHQSTKLVNGNLGWFDAQGKAEGRRIPPESGSVAKAFQLKENEISRPYLSEGGYTLLQVTGIRPEKAKNFDNVKVDIKLALLTVQKSERIRALVAEVVATANVKINEEALKALDGNLAPKPSEVAAPVPTEPVVAPTPKGVPHPMLIKRPNVAYPNAVRREQPIDRNNRDPSISPEEIRKKMGAKNP
jgi:hypothetical protein